LPALHDRLLFFGVSDETVHNGRANSVTIGVYGLSGQMARESTANKAALLASSAAEGMPVVTDTAIGQSVVSTPKASLCAASLRVTKPKPKLLAASFRNMLTAEPRAQSRTG
jgi:hypothetical protein